MILCFWASVTGASSKGIKIKTAEDYISTIRPNISNWQKRAIVKTVIKFSMERNIKFITLLGIIENESHFRYWKCSKNQRTGRKQSCGLMGVNLWEWVYNKENQHNLIKRGIIKSKVDLYNIHYNIKAGSFIFVKTEEICEWWWRRTEWKDKEYEPFPYPNYLVKMGYDNIYDCTITEYNASPTKHEYHKNVITSIAVIEKFFYKK